MSKLKINLDDWAESALYDDHDQTATDDLLEAAEIVAVMQEDKEHPKLSIEDTVREYPLLVAAQALCRTPIYLPYESRKANK